MRSGATDKTGRAEIGANPPGPRQAQLGSAKTGLQTAAAQFVEALARSTGYGLHTSPAGSTRRLQTDIVSNLRLDALETIKAGHRSSASQHWLQSLHNLLSAFGIHRLSGVSGSALAFVRARRRYETRVPASIEQTPGQQTMIIADRLGAGNDRLSQALNSLDEAIVFDTITRRRLPETPSQLERLEIHLHRQETALFNKTGSCSDILTHAIDEACAVRP